MTLYVLLNYILEGFETFNECFSVIWHISLIWDVDLWQLEMAGKQNWADELNFVLVFDDKQSKHTKNTKYFSEFHIVNVNLFIKSIINIHSNDPSELTNFKVQDIIKHHISYQYFCTSPLFYATAPAASLRFSISLRYRSKTFRKRFPKIWRT